MKPLQVAVAGIGAWLAGFEGWPALRAGLTSACSEASPSAPRRPTPLLLPAAERRRVPDGVAVALEVAREALGMAATQRTFDASSMASVFTSAHGDLAIVDYLCAQLARDPTLLSPTRFHHSVHNAAAGYWSIATPSFGPSTALAAGDSSFALGLLEAATQVVAEGHPVLLVAFDTPAVGLLTQTTPNTALFGTALLLVPVLTPRGRTADLPVLSIAIHERALPAPLPAHAAFRALAASSPSARALALLESLALGDAVTVDHPIDVRSSLAVAVQPARIHATPAVAGAIE